MVRRHGCSLVVLATGLLFLIGAAYILRRDTISSATAQVSESGDSSGAFFRGPDEVIKEVPSPDGKYIAVLLYGRSTGPEGGHDFVALRAKGESLRYNRNGEVPDAYSGGQMVFDGIDTSDLEVAWRSKRELGITGNCYNGKKSSSKGSTKWRDVVIIYPECPSKWGGDTR